MHETELRDVGVFRIPLPLPFPQAGGPINAYLIEGDEGLLLLDTGLGTEESQAALVEGLARHGHRLADIKGIVVSHGHIDHYGAAAWIRQQARRPIPVSIHRADAPKVLRSDAERRKWLTRYGAHLASLGMPAGELSKMGASVGRDLKLAQPVTDVEPLAEGDRIKGAQVTLEVFHTPGHTPGLCCLYEPDRKILFSSDHLLEHVSPNPLIDIESMDKAAPFKPLVSYIESIRRVRAMDIALVLPGHASAFTRYRRVIDSLLGFYQRRQSKLLDALRERPLTPYQAMEQLFPSRTAGELFLMISETMGNLEVLEDRGEVLRSIEGERVFFQRAA